MTKYFYSPWLKTKFRGFLCLGLREHEDLSHCHIVKINIFSTGILCERYLLFLLYRIPHKNAWKWYNSSLPSFQSKFPKTYFLSEYYGSVICHIFLSLHRILIVLINIIAQNNWGKKFYFNYFSFWRVFVIYSFLYIGC